MKFITLEGLISLLWNLFREISALLNFELSNLNWIREKKNILIRLFQYTAINTRYILIICNHSTVQRFHKMLVLAVKFGKAFRTGGSVIQLIKHLLNPSNFFTKKEEIKEKICFQFH